MGKEEEMLLRNKSGVRLSLKMVNGNRGHVIIEAGEVKNFTADQIESMKELYGENGLSSYLERIQPRAEKCQGQEKEVEPEEKMEEVVEVKPKKGKKKK